MLLHVSQKELEVAASAVSGLADKSGSTHAAAANVLIEATERGVQFRATDMESMVTVNTEARVEKPGITTIPAEAFRDIVKSLPPSGEVTIELHTGKVRISCETNEFLIVTTPPDDFPIWQMETGNCKFQISQKMLRTMIDSTVYALPAKDHRRVLMGIYVELSDNTLRMTATDGKKLSRIFTSIPEIEGSGEATLILPRKLADNILKTIGSEGPVEVEFSDRQITLRFANITYKGMGIEGKYPDCDQVIPKEFPIVIMLNRDVFLQAVRRAGVTSDERNRSIVLNFDNNKVEFHSYHHDLGAFDGSIPVEYPHERIELAFNHTFLIDTLSKFPSPDVRLLIKNQRSPVVFRNQEDDQRLALLMPIKLSDVPKAAVSSTDEDGGEA
ncbi:MAG: DNA polymerase III subunit beta [Candidatus Sumerlaeia bacterium]|nr:DNA polymerase III subunit beta [Candidatus Sumerlaeia bacterium]